MKVRLIKDWVLTISLTRDVDWPGRGDGLPRPNSLDARVLIERAVQSALEVGEAPGRKVVVIKHVRQLANSGLKATKDWVELHPWSYRR